MAQQAEIDRVNRERSAELVFPAMPGFEVRGTNDQPR